MFRRAAIIILLLVAPPLFAQIQITAFASVSSANPCSPTALDLTQPIDAGSAALGTNDGQKVICIFNAGASAITLTDVTASGSDFALSVQPLPATLQANKANFATVGIIFTPSAVGTRNGQITLTFNTGTPLTVPLVGTGFTDFGIDLPNPGSAIVVNRAGGSFLYDLAIVRASSFTGTITITCTNLPPGASCSVEPTTFAPNSGLHDLFVNIATTAPATAALSGVRSGLAVLLLMPLIGSIRLKQRGLLFATLMFALLFSSCGGSGSRTGPVPTPPATYQVTITATSNGVSHSRTLTMVVQ